MNIDPVYQPLYQQARTLQYQFHDAVGTTDHPTVAVLRQEMQHLVDDLEVKKNPRDIENRIKVIQHQITEVQNQGTPIMSYEHTDHFNRSYEDMRRDVRRLSAYN
jgi:hypothetical protein